jgi:hypothetical protein
LSGGQAAYVLERMLKERRVLQSDVNRYVSEMSAEIGQLEERLRSLRDAVGGAASAAAAGIASAASSAVAAVRGRKPGRPPGSGRGPGRPPGSGRGPGRPAGSGRKPGRPAKAAAAASSSPAATEGASSSTKAAAPAKGAKRGRKTPITSEQLASRQLQGRYLALVRRFPANRRAAFARTAKEKGREAAIREMQDSLPKK